MPMLCVECKEPADHWRHGTTHDRPCGCHTFKTGLTAFASEARYVPPSCTHYCEEGHFTGDDMTMRDMDVMHWKGRAERAEAILARRREAEAAQPLDPTIERAMDGDR